MFSLSTLFGCKSEKKDITAKEVVTKVDVATFKEGITNSDIQLVDVRTAQEFKDGYIENAQLIDYKLDDFRDKIQELDKDKPVYLYCRSGNRSGKASKIMLELGFKEIVDLKGGYKAWSKK